MQPVAAYLLRLGAFLVICVMTVWVALMVVSIALGTTEFGTASVAKATVHAWAWWLMWGAVATMVLHRAWIMFLGLMTKLRLD